LGVLVALNGSANGSLHYYFGMPWLRVNARFLGQLLHIRMLNRLERSANTFDVNVQMSGQQS
jgi:hypothetical protein